MILSDKAIRLNNIVSPCEERTVFRGKSYGLSCCGYDVRVDLGARCYLAPGQSILVATVEHFNMPPNVCGFVKDKSTWARQGLFVSQAVLEPGWKGYLSVRIANLGDAELTIVDREPIAQVIFQWIDGVPENTYSSKYMGQERGPQGPKFES